MPFFIPNYITSEIYPLLQIVSDIDRATQQHSRPAACKQRGTYAPRSVVAPRFDLRETDKTYELTGELPGFDQANVSIEWTDEKTLRVSGHSVTERTEGSLVLEKPAVAASTEAEDDDDANSDAHSDAASEDSTNYHPPTVEDEVEGADAKEDASNASTSNQEKGKEDTATVAEKHPTPVAAKPSSRFWVQERSSGRFTRSFRFGRPVDHEGVHASLRNGVLQVVVPKAQPKPLRRVQIE